MKAVFTKAFNVMTACDCYDQTMDGCYRCILEYRNSYGMEQTKIHCPEMLRELIDESVAWVQSSHPGAVEQEPWVDSELETRFPRAIGKFFRKRRGVGKSGPGTQRCYQPTRTAFAF